MGARLLGRRIRLTARHLAVKQDAQRDGREKIRRYQDEKKPMIKMVHAFVSSEDGLGSFCDGCMIGMNYDTCLLKLGHLSGTPQRLIMRPQRQLAEDGPCHCARDPARRA